MVVGAGRGPLVDASLRAAISVDRRVMIYAVEKNPGAVVTYVGQLTNSVFESLSTLLAFKIDISMALICGIEWNNRL